MKKFHYLFIVLLFIIVIISKAQVQAATDYQVIRVGLESQYKNKSVIEIKTTKIGLGYSYDNNFSEEMGIDSETGFELTPATGYFFRIDKVYTNYEQAKNVASTIEQLDIKAYPVITYKGSWQVYIGGDKDINNVQNQYNKVLDRFGFRYSNIMDDNGYRVLLKGQKDTILIDVDDHNVYPQMISYISNSAGVKVIDLGNRVYRGRIEIGRYQNNSLTAINIINIEHYLYGVVPSEMISSWPMEALKAQAVCARGYAVLKAGYVSQASVKKPYRINDTTESQVYKGYSAETSRTNQAVDATKGETVSYKNQIVSTYFFSTSGGRTQNVEDVWSKAAPYLRSVPDLYENDPAMKPWVISLTRSQINNKLLGKGYNIGNILDIFPEIKTESGHVYSLKVKGSTKNVVLQTGTIRSTLSLYSTKFKVIEYGDKPDKVIMKGRNSTSSKQISQSYIIDGSFNVKKASQTLDQYIAISEDNRTNFPRITPKSKDVILFAGQGYGHGVGMSQSGAKGMAEAGFTYKEILKHYFVGTEVR